MAKMKWDDDIDWKGLNDEEYDDSGDFEDYDGPVPPKGTLLNGDIKKVWLSESSTGNMMLRVLFEAADNEGDNKDYDGCPVWDNVVFTSPKAKFRWQPFFDALGFTLKDLKAKTVVGEEDNVGTVVDSIGKVEFPCPAAIRTDIEKKGEYKGSVRVGKWLPPLDSDLEDDSDEDDEDSF